MTDPTFVMPTTSPTPVERPQSSRPRAGSRRPPRPARPRAATTVSAAILTDRGLAEGYVALPLARLMAYRVWPSIETLNQQLVLLEQNCFTRMTSDRTFEAQGAAFGQLLRAYAAVTEAVATLGQRLAQNRLTEQDHLLLATGHLALLLPPAPTAPAMPSPEPAAVTPPAAGPEAIPDTGPEVAFDAAAPERPTDLPALTPVSNGVTGEVP
jgi:hypothetical protein